ncbi:translation initiation factor IF-2-like isoform X2 [Coturnix japonica]|uniref:translation initiation factor IF-2-like isoform X2 n=1 Tax=Coturnix japonica TaxID=93934 RepID=UPI0013A5E6AA|nr:translation initiation factor IF-2-like isoform X2 [Coturnix japonica]
MAPGRNAHWELQSRAPFSPSNPCTKRLRFPSPIAPNRKLLPLYRKRAAKHHGRCMLQHRHTRYRPRVAPGPKNPPGTIRPVPGHERSDRTELGPLTTGWAHTGALRPTPVRRGLLRFYCGLPRSHCGLLRSSSRPTPRYPAAYPLPSRPTPVPVPPVPVLPPGPRSTRFRSPPRSRFRSPPGSGSGSDLAARRDVPGVGQHEGAELVEVLDRSAPFLGGLSLRLQPRQRLINCEQ